MSDKEKKTCGNCGWAVHTGSKDWVVCARLKNTKIQSIGIPVRKDQLTPNCWAEHKYKS